MAEYGHFLFLWTAGFGDFLALCAYAGKVDKLYILCH